MYSFVVLLSDFGDKLHVLFSMMIACILATAVFYLTIAPAHNLLKAYVAHAQGDERVKDRGHLRFKPRKSFSWVGAASSVLLFMPIVHPLYYRNTRFYNRTKGTCYVAISGTFFYLLCGILFSFAYLVLSEQSFYGIRLASASDVAFETAPIIYHCFFSTVYFLCRLCLFSFFINFLPISPFDMGDILALFLRLNWVDVIKNNEVMVSFVAMLASALTFARPSGLYSQWTADIISFLGLLF